VTGSALLLVLLLLCAQATDGKQHGRKRGRTGSPDGSLSQVGSRPVRALPPARKSSHTTPGSPAYFCLPPARMLEPAYKPSVDRRGECARQDPVTDFALLLIPRAAEAGSWVAALESVGARDREVLAWLPALQPPAPPSAAFGPGHGSAPGMVAAALLAEWGAVLGGTNHLRVFQAGGRELTDTEVLLRGAMALSAEILIVAGGAQARNAPPADATAPQWLTKAAVSSVLAHFQRNPQLGVLGFCGISHSCGSNSSQLGSGELSFGILEDSGSGFAVRREALAALRPLLPCSGLSRGLLSVLSRSMWTSGWQAASATAPPFAACQAAGPSNPWPSRGASWQADNLMPEAEELLWQSCIAGRLAGGQEGCMQLLTGVAEAVPLAKRCQEAATWGLAVQYYKQPGNLRALSTGLLAAISAMPATEDSELVVMNDSSSELLEWVKQLQGISQRSESLRATLLVASNNLHEIRAYNAASRLLHCRLLAFLQDDDDPGADPTWLPRAHALMEARPRLGLLGGHRGRLDCGRSGLPAAVDPKRRQADGLKFGTGHTPIPTIDPITKQPFMFAYKVNAAPLMVRRELLLGLGGLHSALSCPGDPGIGFDFELSVRIWAEGYQVGLFEAKFDRAAHRSSLSKGATTLTSGTRKDKAKHRVRIHNYHRNNADLYSMYPGFHHDRGTKLALDASRALPRAYGQQRSVLD